MYRKPQKNIIPEILIIKIEIPNITKSNLRKNVNDRMHACQSNQVLLNSRIHEPHIGKYQSAILFTL